MKKVISLLLTLVMLMSLCTVFASVSTVSATAVSVGDANNDGKINSRDILLLRMLIAGRLDGGYSAGADVNSDGRFTSADVTALKRYVSGYSSSFTPSVISKTVKEVKIGSNDISKYEIVLTEPPAEYRCSENYNYGSRILRNYINDATGYYLAFTRTPTEGKKHIFYATDTTGALGKEGYTLKVENGDLYITGGNRRGCTYAVCDILKKYIGWRFYESGCEYCYPSNGVTIPANLDVTHIPTFGYRDVHWNPWIDEGYDDIGLLCNAEHINSHTDRVVMESPKYGAYGEGNTWANAHSFDIIFGISGWSQPCLASASNMNTAAQFWINELTNRANNDANTYIGFNLSRVSVSWNDNESYCYCANCSAIYREEQSIAGTIVRFDNVVSTAIANVYPEVETYYIAYGSARVPPMISTPNEHCVVCYCWNGCNNHTFDSNECSENGNVLGYTNWEERYYFEAWSRIVPNKLFVWYYMTNFNWLVSPCPNIMNIKADIKYLADHGADGMYCEMESEALENFEGLKAYLAAECMWNPDITDAEYEALIDEYLAYRFGAGWNYIRQYIDIATEAGNRCGCFANNFDWIGNMYNFDYMYEQFDTIVSLFDNAYNAASDNSQRSKIEKLSIHAYFIALCGAYNGHGNDANVRERYQKLYNMVTSYGYRLVSSAVGVPGPSDEFYSSPALLWLDLPYDATWETYYRVEGRTLPRDMKNCSGRLSRPYMTTVPTKSNNPYENLGR